MLEGCVQCRKLEGHLRWSELWWSDLVLFISSFLRNDRNFSKLLGISRNFSEEIGNSRTSSGGVCSVVPKTTKTQTTLIALWEINAGRMCPVQEIERPLKVVRALMVWPCIIYFEFSQECSEFLRAARDFSEFLGRNRKFSDIFGRCLLSCT